MPLMAPCCKLATPGLAFGEKNDDSGEPEIGLRALNRNLMSYFANTGLSALGSQWIEHYPC